MRFGLGARKGRVAVGYEADLVLVDAQAPVDSISPLYTRAGYSVFAPDMLRGRITTTLLRGEVVARDRRVGSAPTGVVISSVEGNSRGTDLKETT